MSEQHHTITINSSAMRVALERSQSPLRAYVHGGALTVVSEDYGPSMVGLCPEGLDCEAEHV